MSVTPVNSSSSQAAVANTVNSLAKELESTKSVQVFKDDTGTRRVILDKDGLRTSEAGVDVFNATNDQLTFNSNNNVFKVVQSGEASGAVASLTENATDTTTIPHNLGFAPAAIVYVNGTGSTYLTSGRYYPTPTAISIKIGTVYHPGIIFEYQIDDTNLYLTVTNRSTATPITDIGTVNWKYYLLQETAN